MEAYNFKAEISCYPHSIPVPNLYPYILPWHGPFILLLPSRKSPQYNIISENLRDG